MLRYSLIAYKHLAELVQPGDDAFNYPSSCGMPIRIVFVRGGSIQSPHRYMHLIVAISHFLACIRIVIALVGAQALDAVRAR